MRKNIAAEKRRVQAIRRYYADLRARYALTEDEAVIAQIICQDRMGAYDYMPPNLRQNRQNFGRYIL